SRLMALFAGWLAAAGGAWLIIGPSLARTIHLNLGQPNPASRTGVQALAWLVHFYAIGAVIVFVASVALGRLSVRTMRDVEAARRRLAEEEAAQAGVAPAAGYPREPAMATMGRHTGPQQPATQQPASQIGQPGYPAAPPPPGYQAEQTQRPPENPPPTTE
ncbi:MAG TPA: hypothetical protein VKB75_13000, partial [Jatrophihabitans sp.]|nr:hypothetical protein [Jatrophihabitans sp.]